MILGNYLMETSVLKNLHQIVSQVAGTGVMIYVLYHLGNFGSVFWPKTAVYKI